MSCARWLRRRVNMFLFCMKVKFCCGTHKMLNESWKFFFFCLFCVQCSILYMGTIPLLYTYLTVLLPSVMRTSRLRSLQQTCSQ